MRSKAKSTRENITLDYKPLKVSEETIKPKKNPKSDEAETRKYLLKTLALLQQHLKITKIHKTSNNLQLSSLVY